MTLTISDLSNFVVDIAGVAAILGPLLLWAMRSLRNFILHEINGFKNEILVQSEKIAVRRESQIEALTNSQRQLCDAQKEANQEMVAVGLKIEGLTNTVALAERERAKEAARVEALWLTTFGNSAAASQD